jgi:hypothetical protein
VWPFFLIPFDSVSIALPPIIKVAKESRWCLPELNWNLLDLLAVELSMQLTHKKSTGAAAASMERAAHQHVGYRTKWTLGHLYVGWCSSYGISKTLQCGVIADVTWWR